MSWPEQTADSFAIKIVTAIAKTSRALNDRSFRMDSSSSAKVISGRLLVICDSNPKAVFFEQKQWPKDNLQRRNVLLDLRPMWSRNLSLPVAALKLLKS
jgi:hypothetical protein